MTTASSSSPTPLTWCLVCVCCDGLENYQGVFPDWNRLLVRYKVGPTWPQDKQVWEILFLWTSIRRRATVASYSCSLSGWSPTAGQRHLPGAACPRLCCDVNVWTCVWFLYFTYVYVHVFPGLKRMLEGLSFESLEVLCGDRIYCAPVAVV